MAREVRPPGPKVLNRRADPRGTYKNAETGRTYTSDLCRPGTVGWDLTLARNWGSGLQ